MAVCAGAHTLCTESQYVFVHLWASLRGCGRDFPAAQGEEGDTGVQSLQGRGCRVTQRIGVSGIWVLVSAWTMSL